MRQGFLEPRAIIPGAAHFIGEDSFAARFGEGMRLEFEVLVLGGNAGIADAHGNPS
jgi:hypothetical protein